VLPKVDYLRKLGLGCQIARDGITIRSQAFGVCFVVREYRPYQRKDGRFIWRKYRDLTGPLTFTQLLLSPYRPMAGQSQSHTQRRVCRSWHNAPLTSQEEIMALGEQIASARDQE